MEVLTRLQTLAAGIVGPEVTVEAGEAWSCDIRSLRITVRAEELATRPWRELGAVMLHELGHALETHPEGVPQRDLFEDVLGDARMADRQVVQHAMLNTFEDPRVEHAVARRLPGAGWYLASLRTHPLEDAGERPELAPARFLHAHLGRWRGDTRRCPVPEVEDALVRTEQDRIAVTRSVPSTTGPWSRARSAEAHRVAVQILVERVLPDLKDLIRVDLLPLQRWLVSHPRHREVLRASLRRGDLEVYRAVLRGVTRGRGLAGDVVVGALARRAYGEALAARLASRAASADLVGAALDGEASDGRADLASDLERLLAGMARERPRRAERPVSWQELEAETRCHMARLVRVLESVLPPERATLSARRHLEGHAVDRRRLVQWMAQREDPAVFRRKRRPVRGQRLVGVLVDRSGSMRAGGKCLAAAKAAWLVARVAERLAADVAVWGFREEVEPIVAPTGRLQPRDRNAIAGLASGACGGNDDARCVQEVAEQLLRHRADRKLLLVLSDGAPSEGSDPEKALKDVLEGLRGTAGLTLIGIGVGPGTEAVGGLYPFGEGDVPVEALADRVGRLVRKALVGR